MVVYFQLCAPQKFWQVSVQPGQVITSRSLCSEVAVSWVGSSFFQLNFSSAVQRYVVCFHYYHCRGLICCVTIVRSSFHKSYHIISYHMRKHFRTQMCEITVIVLAEHKAMYHHRQGLIVCTLCFTIAVADPRHATSCAQGRASCHSEVNCCHSLLSVLVIFAS